MLKSISAILAMVATLLLTAGCGQRETQVESGIRTQTFHLGNLAEPLDLDPHIITSLQDFQIIMGLFEGLTNYHPKTNLPTPGVATHWESSADAQEWTFHLRDNARWSNGQPVTAHDFVWSIQRALSPRLASEYASMLFILKNGKAYYDEEITDFAEVGVRAPDDHTVVYTLDHPVPFFDRMAAHAMWYPVNRDNILAHGAMDDRGTLWTRPGNLIGNGPFTLTEWSPNQVIRIDKNPTYWDAANVRLNTVNLYPIESLATEEAAFRSGQLHATVSIPQEKIPVYQNDPERAHLLNQAPQLGTYFFRLNVERPPLDNVLVRRALSMAVNRVQIIDRVAKGNQLPAYSLCPPNIAGYQGPDVIAHDPDQARRLLAEAGYPNGEGFPRLELLYNTNEGHRAIAEALQQMWRTELNIDIGIYNQEARVWNDTMRETNYDIARYAWIGDYLDASTFLDLMTKDNGNNQTNWSHPEYDRLVEEARYVIDDDSRFALYREAERILIEDSPIIPLYFYTNNQLQVPALKGWEGNLLDLHPYNRVYLEP